MTKPTSPKTPPLPIINNRDIFVRLKLALFNTQKKYSQLLNEESISHQDKEFAWDAMFVLRYIDFHYRRTQSFFNFLQKTIDLTAFSKMLEQITIDPSVDLYGYLKKLQDVMKSEEMAQLLQDTLQKNRNGYLRTSILMGMGAAGTAALGITIFTLLLLSSVNPAVGILLGLVIAFSTLAGFSLFGAASSIAYAHSKEVNRIKTSVQEKDSLPSTFESTIILPQTSIDSIQSITYDGVMKKTFPPEETAKIQQRFFNHQGRKLSEEVQVEFNTRP